MPSSSPRSRPFPCRAASLAAIALVLAAAWSPAARPATAAVVPKDLLIYYGRPSGINGAGGVAAAAAELAAYDTVVLGDGLEKATHPDHANTVAILAALHAQATTRVFGYVDLGVSTQDLPLADVELRIDEWIATGADGIFLDDYGYDFLVTRARQNAAVDAVHGRGRPVIANGWNPDHVFSGAVDPLFNPDGLPTSLGSDDFYLSESFQVAEGGYQDETAWWTKASLVEGYRAVLGFRVLSVTTNDAANAYDEAAFFYAWYSALLCGHEATGWGEYLFAASTGAVPWRARPAVDPGSTFAGDAVAESPLYRRDTDAGRVTIDAAAHVGAFAPGAVAIGDAAVSSGRGLPSIRCEPNPVRSGTTIVLELPRPARARLEIVSVAGRRVAVPLAGALLGAGSHRVRFDTNDLPGGVYYVRMEADGIRRSCRMTHVR